MRILITGGAGFIGSHLCDRLWESGHDIICVDNLFTGSVENIRHLLDRPRFTFFKHDIISPLDLPQALGADHVLIDQVYNLACPASPVHYQHNPVRTIKANTIGVINVLGLARAYGARILQTSTSEVYGDPDRKNHPQSEEYRGNVNPIGPRACYDEGKRCAETLFFDYHRMHGMEIKIVRLFNVYGPRMAFNDGRVVSNFILQALNGEPMTIYGDGTQTRSFCYVDELVDGLIRMMNSPAEVTGPINLGNPEEIPIREFGINIARILRVEPRFIHKDLPADDPRQRCPDISKAMYLLKWQPVTGLTTGLERTIADFKKRLGV